MNFKTKLENKEGSWVRVHFMDSSYFTGVLRQVGIDFIELECFGEDAPSNPMLKQQALIHSLPDSHSSRSADSHSYTKHVIPVPLIKFVTVEASTFISEEKKRLEHIAQRAYVGEQYNNMPDLEK